jgi:hypothetical protein
METKIDLDNLRLTTDENKLIIKRVNFHRKGDRYTVGDHDFYINKVITIEQTLPELLYDFFGYGRRAGMGFYDLEQKDFVNYMVYFIRGIVKKRIYHINIYYYPGSIRIEIH